jgi:hypothetical protein
MTMPGCLLAPLFIACGIFWVFGPSWSWIPFLLGFGVLTAITFMAGPSSLVIETPAAAQSTSSTYSLIMFIAIGVGIGLLFKGRYWEVILCVIVLILSGLIWPKLRTLGPL